MRGLGDALAGGVVALEEVDPPARVRCRVDVRLVEVVGRGREVDRQAGERRRLRAGGSVDDDIVQGLEHGVGQVGHVERLGADRGDQRAEVGHVEVLGRVGTPAVRRVAGEGAADLGSHRIGPLDQRRRKRRHRLVERRHLGEVEHGQRAVGSAVGDEAVDDRHAEVVDAGAWVGGEHAEHAVVPPSAGFGFGAGDQPVGVGLEGAGDLVRRHQAGIEAQQVEALRRRHRRGRSAAPAGSRADPARTRRRSGRVRRRARRRRGRRRSGRSAPPGSW